MKKGDIVTIIETDETPVFKAGDKARLTYQDEDGDWWADFSINEVYVEGGEWCLQKGYTRYCKEL